MSGPYLTGAETALQTAILQHLSADEGVTSILGDPPRVFDQVGAYPTFPFLEISAHEVKPAAGVDVDLMEHRLDLRVLTQWGGRSECRQVLSVIRQSLEAAQLTLADHTLVYCFPVFSDVLMLKDGKTVRGTVRLKAVTQAG